MLFFIIVNYLTTPGTIWFIYPTLALIQWPISIYCFSRGKVKEYSLVTSLLLILYLNWENQMHSPEHLWFLYPAFAIIWWPILMFAGHYARTLSMALIGSLGVIVSYGLLNALVSPQFPWAIFPAYAVLWWPLAIYFSSKKKWFNFSVWAAIMSAVFFITANTITTTDIWAIYPIFALTWWPLSMHYYRRAR
ncbi:hypothetical protein K7P76_04465 [Cohnella sp. NL03-T5]|nr:hypothetical protein [Cohnella silvisoli]